MTDRMLNRLAVTSFANIDRFDSVTAVATSRAGGVSRAPYDTLNLGLNTDDRRVNALTNREALREITSLSADSIVTAGQVHGVNVAVVTGSDVGRHFDATDALVTNTADVPLMILVADCVGVAIVDPDNGVVAAVHAGWRGTLANIVGKTIAKMSEAFGTSPGDVVAGIGPSIGPCCYTVGGEVVDEFYGAHAEIAGEILTTPEFASAGSFEGAVNEDAKQLDLWKANALLLEAAGVPSANIEQAETCTSCNNDRYFSHRADNGTTGRSGVVVMRHEETRRRY